MPEKHPIDNYLTFYFLIGIPGMILAVLAPSLEIPYALMFFGLSANLIFSIQQILDDIEHSSISHFEYFSRYNTFNYIIAGLIILSALLFVFTPFSRVLTLFVLWTLSALVIPRIGERYSKLEFLELIADYIWLQMEIEDSKILEAVHLIADNPDIEVWNLAEKIGVNYSVAEEITHYFRVYTEQNS